MKHAIGPFALYACLCLPCLRLKYLMTWCTPLFHNVLCLDLCMNLDGCYSCQDFNVIGFLHCGIQAASLSLNRLTKRCDVDLLGD